MPKTFALRIVTPDGDPVEREVTSVVLPGAAGSLGVQAGHEPWTVLLREGSVDYAPEGGRWEHLRIRAGVAQIEPDATTIVADVSRS